MSTASVSPFFVTVPKQTVKDVGVVSAFVFGQILNWFQPNTQKKSKLRIDKEEELWLAKSCSDIVKECHVSLKQARSAVRELVKADYLRVEIRPFHGRNTNHFQLGGKGRPFCWFVDPHKKDSALRQALHVPQGTRNNPKPTDTAHSSTHIAPEGTVLQRIQATNTSNELKKENVTSNCIQITGIIAKEMPEVPLSPSFLFEEETEEELRSKRLEREEEHQAQAPVEVLVTAPASIQHPIQVSIPPQPTYQQPPPPLPPQATGLGNRTGVQVLSIPSYPGVAWPGGGQRQYAHQSHRIFGARAWENREDRPTCLPVSLSAAVDLVRRKTVRSERDLIPLFAAQRTIQVARKDPWDM